MPLGERNVSVSPRTSAKGTIFSNRSVNGLLKESVRVDTVHRVFTTKSLSKKRAREHSFTFFYEEKTFAGVSLVIQESAGKSVVAQQIKKLHRISSCAWNFTRGLEREGFPCFPQMAHRQGCASRFCFYG